MKSIFKKIISISLIFMIAITLIACNSNTANDNEKITKDLVMYNQEILPDLIAQESNPTEFAKLYEKTTAEFIEKYNDQLTEKAKSTLTTEIFSSIQEKLRQLTLPLEITDITSQQEDSQTIHIQFTDSSKKTGEFVFKVQNTEKQISYISLEQ